MASGNQVQPAASPFSDDDLASIQGIGIAGFKKDHQELIFFTLGTGADAKALIAALAPRIASAEEVGDFNEDFSEALHQHGQDPEMKALWIGLGLSASGLGKLGTNLSDMTADSGRDSFIAGMAARAADTGDVGDSDPAKWHPAFRTRGGVDAVLVVAADDLDQLDQVIAELGELITHHDGVVVFQERGETLPGDLRGREHFGFKDGASQPAIVGYDPNPAPNEPQPVPAGEFVLGYPDAAGPTPQVTPAWRNGSFLVFRRLIQNVIAFRSLINAPVPGADPPITPEEMGAKTLGRWRSGAPLAKYPGGDPGPGHADNDFGYQAADDVGLIVPTLGSHSESQPERRVAAAASHRGRRCEQAPDGPPRHPLRTTPFRGRNSRRRQREGSAFHRAHGRLGSPVRVRAEDLDRQRELPEGWETAGRGERLLAAEPWCAWRRPGPRGRRREPRESGPTPPAVRYTQRSADRRLGKGDRWRILLLPLHRGH